MITYKIQEAKDILSLGDAPGVYFLFSMGELIYIGSSIGVIKRVRGHVSRGKMTFDEFSYIECPREDILEEETKYIVKYNPPKNRVLPTNSTMVTKREVLRAVFSHLEAVVGESNCDWAGNFEYLSKEHADSMTSHLISSIDSAIEKYKKEA